jgi:glycosyltransferase involved in cell wall biosynthesis
MRIGIVKPEYRIAGGFERLLSRIRNELIGAGHTVTWVLVSVDGVGNRPYRVGIPPRAWDRAWHFFRYAGLLEEFDALDLSGYDMVISSQPPSFAAHHQRQLALFYHHERTYYDLSEVYVRAGFADAKLHDITVKHVRAMDGPRIQAVKYFLATSDEVSSRLRMFNDLEGNVGAFSAGVGLSRDPLADDASEVFAYPMCVSRHEFPKRTELFIHALKYIPEATGVAVGGGGRLDYVRWLDEWLSDPRRDLDAVTADELWLNRGDIGLTRILDSWQSNVRLLGSVEDEDLHALYRNALCLVAPAYHEDYGLTAVEAMAYGKPAIVCNDGGGLRELVEDGVTGFVVAPTGRAIAEAIRRLRDDSSLARDMGLRARERAAEFTWSRAMAQIHDGIEAVMS